jgi:hypothetical protein
MWDMLEGFYLDILSVTLFLIKNIYFSSINKVLLVVFKMSGYSENGIIRCSIYSTTRNDYASIILTISGKLYYITHGGFNCASQNIFSDIFAIDLMGLQYFSFHQIVTFP